MTVTFLDKTYVCTTAIKGADYAHLLDDTGLMIAAFDGVKDFSLFTLTGGAWTEVTDYDGFNIAVVAPDGTMRKSSKTLANKADLENGKVPSSQLPATTYTTTTMLATGWSNGTYSFEASYPNTGYNLSIEVAPTATAEQFEAFCAAMICGSADSNVAKALGDVPTADIPIIIKAVQK